MKKVELTYEEIELLLDTKTLIHVVADINYKYEHICRTGNFHDPYTEGYLDGLEMLMDYFQGFIDAAREKGE